MQVIQPHDESSSHHSGNSSAAGGGIIADSSDACSVRSAATERMTNIKSTPASVAAATVRPESSTWIMEEREVKYEEGGTELFTLVEDAKWEDVCDR